MKDEQIEEGLAVAGETLDAAHRIGRYHFLAELHRLNGELLANYEIRDADWQRNPIAGKPQIGDRKLKDVCINQSGSLNGNPQNRFNYEPS